MLNRRKFVSNTAIASMLLSPKVFAMNADPLEAAARILDDSVKSGEIRSAAIVARKGERRVSQSFGIGNIDSPYLLGSISKPICVAAVMSVFDEGKFSLDDPVQRYLPEFVGENRGQVMVSHLLTHVSGLPDQLPNNAELRRGHAPLSEFVRSAVQVPLAFEPGKKYEYSSMAILLATEIAQRLSGVNFLELVSERVLKPLQMSRSALGVGQLKASELVQVQTEKAAVESGGGDPTAKEWDWNSSYWRALGAPWGCLHASAGDVMKFLDAFETRVPSFLRPETLRLMIQNHNGPNITPRGLGFALGTPGLCQGCSTDAYGHTGSTGTIAWNDRANKTACVILTSLPAQAVSPHPRELASACVASG